MNSTQHSKNPRLRERTNNEPGLVTFCDIGPWNGAGLFIQPGVHMGWMLEPTRARVWLTSMSQQPLASLNYIISTITHMLTQSCPYLFK